jgi:hypothetical protein
VEKRDDFYIPEEIAEWIGLKKSEYLSKLIGHQSPDDVGFEQFHLFDDHIPGTIEVPDKVYERMEDDQRLRTYVRSYSEKGSFHQVVIGVLVDDKEKNASVFIPILCFVSKKNELVREFSVGNVITKPTLN